jgi:phytoene dehydrogenase-like protein
MSEYDYVLVGGGVNALVAAAMLGKKRRTALVLERNAMIGGCLRTEEVTAPGFVHDVMAMTLVLFRTSPAYQALGPDLEARGFGFAFADANLPAPARSTSSSSGARSSRASITAPLFPTSTTSARRPIRAQGWAASPASCSRRRFS